MKRQVVNFKRKLISFDWALKKLLRSKANFVILEGFLSELLREDIKIQEILESATNKRHEDDKSNQVDLLVKNHKEELIIIELQYDYEVDYMQRILYGTSKIISENLVAGMTYSSVKKVISISIVYFDLGQGEDYVYHGTTRFIGLHNNDELKLSDAQKKFYGTDEAHKIYLEYYILKVNQFNEVAKDGLDEWIYFFKNDEVKKGFTARGLKEAASELDVMKMPLEEQQEYEHYYDDLRRRASAFESSYVRGEKEGMEKGEAKGKLEGEKIGLEKGKLEGEKIGLEKGKLAEKLEMVRKLKKQGVPIEVIVAASGLAIEEIEKL